MTLAYYYAAGSCSLIGMVALNCAGAAYTPVAITLSGDRTALRAVNPANKVPVLLMDGEPLTETIAILFWIASRFPAATILPDNADDLAEALSLMSALASSLHIRRRQYARPISFCSSPDAQSALSAAALAPYWEELVRLDTRLTTQTRDAVTGCIAIRAYALLFHRWAHYDGLPIDRLTCLTAMANAFSHHAAASRAIALHDIGTATARDPRRKKEER